MLFCCLSTDTEAAPYVPSTSFKSYSKEHAATASNGRSNAAGTIDNDSIDNDTIDIDIIDNDTIDSDDASKPADDSGSIGHDTIDSDTTSHSAGKPGARRWSLISLPNLRVSFCPRGEQSCYRGIHRLAKEQSNGGIVVPFGIHNSAP